MHHLFFNVLCSLIQYSVIKRFLKYWKWKASKRSWQLVFDSLLIALPYNLSLFCCVNTNVDLFMSELVEPVLRHSRFAPRGRQKSGTLFISTLTLEVLWIGYRSSKPLQQECKIDSSNFSSDVCLYNACINNSLLI